MRKPVLVALFAVGLVSVTAAGALPISPPLASTSNAEQIHIICDQWGRCWRQPDYYDRHGYYLHEDDDSPRYYPYQNDQGYYRPHYWGDHEHFEHDRWHRGWHGDDEDEDEQ